MLLEGEAQSPEAFRQLLATRAPAFHLSLSGPSLERISGFLAALDVARRQTNLTGPLTAQQLVDHALESVLVESLIPHGARVVDIGSGAGFPGLPLAAVRPDIRVTPVEPRRRRREFLSKVCADVGIGNVTAPETSLGKLAQGSADVAVSRAVGQIESVLGKAPFLKGDGLFIAWTTDAPSLARRLGSRFVLETRLPVPQSRRKVIACFRGSDVPRGTNALTISD